MSQQRTMSQQEKSLQTPDVLGSPSRSVTGPNRNERRNERARGDTKADKKAAFELKHITFDPRAKELTTTWSTSAPTIYCVNAYPNGVTASVHPNTHKEASQKGETTQKEGTQKEEEANEDRKSDEPCEETCTESDGPRYLPNQFHLRTKDTRDYLLAPGRYFLFKEGYAQSLERQLSQWHKHGNLSSSVCYFGVTADPFLSFNQKFDVTMKCLELFEHYQPGFLVVQTRSPMILSALPLLKAFGNRAAVAMSIESPLEHAINRYTPGQPPISDRLIAAEGLRRQGITLNLVVSPVLPYGDFYRDAWSFAEMLVERSEYITFGSLTTGRAADESQLRTLSVSVKLAQDKNFRWLRPHSYRYLYYAVQTLAPEKLLLPTQVVPKSSQLSLFAA